MEVEHTIKKVCSRVDCTGSAVLPKPGSGRPATASACTVCHCKTIFPLVGPTKLQNNVSKTLIVKKSDSYPLFTIIGHCDTRWQKMTSFPKSWYTAFSFSGWMLKIWQGENNGYLWKIYAIWWNIKINLQKLVDICGYEFSTNLQTFMQKDLTEVKYSKTFGGYFFRHFVVAVFQQWFWFYWY